MTSVGRSFFMSSCELETEETAPPAGRWAGAAAGTAGGAGLISWDQSTLSALRTPIPGAADIGEY